MAFFDTTKIFNVYVNRDKPDWLEDAKFVQEGFSFFAFVLPVVWALFYRTWLILFILVAINIGFGTLVEAGLLSQAELGVLQLGLAIYVGFEANDWYGSSLQRKGYKLEAIIAAKNLLEAQRQFFGNKHYKITSTSSIGYAL